MNVAFPIGISIFLFDYYLIKQFMFRESWKIFLKKIRLSFFIAIFIFNSSIINSLVDISDCQSINSRLYIRNYLLEDCNSDRYLIFFYSFSIPVFIMTAIILPILAIVYLFRQRNKIYDKEIMKNIGFLINGYRGSFYYW